ncbi:UNVERIFIED_CONTAM: Cis-muuroladiene synthase, partial [Sesamum latifolium]
VAIGKILPMLTVMDDTYDNYATLEEANLFTEILENLKQVAKAYNQHMQWFMGGQIPTYEEYIANTVVTSCIYAILLAIIPGIKSASKETIDWLITEPKGLIASTRVCRYADDMGSDEVRTSKSI